MSDVAAVPTEIGKNMNKGAGGMMLGKETAKGGALPTMTTGSDGALLGGGRNRPSYPPGGSGDGKSAGMITMTGNGHGGGNQRLQQAIGSMSQSQSSGGANPRTYKEMVEAMKKLHSLADDTQERICKLYGEFAEVTLKAAFLFDPVTIQILGDRFTEIGGLQHPDEVHFTRESVNDAYIELSQVLSQRPPVESEL